MVLVSKTPPIVNEYTTKDIILPVTKALSRLTLDYMPQRLRQNG